MPRWLAGVVWAAMGALVVGLVVRAVESRGFYWADDYAHLQISRLALQDPRWMLDVWGRPLMTVAYMPAAPFGDGAVRATSLVLLGLTAVACASIARARGLILAPAAALLLLGQPLTARIGFSALPYTVFSLVLAGAFWLRARGKAAAAVAVASLLPLARLEGLFVLVVWAVVLVAERRARLVPLLTGGIAVWGMLGALVSGDWLWLWHNNPYGLLGSRYGAAGWRYVFYAYPSAVGPVVGGLALAALAWPWATDRLTSLLALGLPLFYALAWGLPAFQTLSDPVYLVTASVPFALFAHGSLVRLLSAAAVPRWPGEIAAAACVVPWTVFERGKPPGLALVLGVILGFGRLGQHLGRVSHAIAVGALIAAAAAAGLHLTKPLPLGLPALLSKQLATSLGERAAEVALWSDPAFGWYAGRLPEMGWEHLPDLPSGALVAWDSKFAAHQWATSEIDMRTMGFDLVWETQEAWARVILWRRR